MRNRCPALFIAVMALVGAACGGTPATSPHSCAHPSLQPDALQHRDAGPHSRGHRGRDGYRNRHSDAHCDASVHRDEPGAQRPDRHCAR